MHATPLIVVIGTAGSVGQDVSTYAILPSRT